MKLLPLLLLLSSCAVQPAMATQIRSSILMESCSPNKIQVDTNSVDLTLALIMFDLNQISESDVLAVVQEKVPADVETTKSLLTACRGRPA